MTNENIVAALEAFVGWGVDDKIKVVRALSDAAVDNVYDWLHQNLHFQERMQQAYGEYRQGLLDGLAAAD